MGALHIGTDGGGSIRIPAAFTGVFGLKPTYGRVPAWPLSPFGDVSHLGPITRSVADAALMLTVLSEPDARDWQALPPDRRDWRVGLDDGVHGLRIAWSPAFGGAAVDPEVAEITAAAAAAFGELGAEVVREDPEIEPTHEIFRRIWYSGAVGALAGIPEERRADIDPGLAEIAREGAAIPHVDHLEAGLARGRLGLAMSLFLDRYDLLLTPALPIPAFAAGREVPDGSGMRRWTEWTRFSYPFNLTQQPAASVPCGLTAAGLPVGLQIVGPRHGEALVLRAARAFEARHPFAFPGEPRTPGRSPA
jgi:aspartyl-tRNA(Asn)/glutamyl-tRNA(Gln) amidotransferase subunit A